jgi:hypothetical protein
MSKTKKPGVRPGNTRVSVLVVESNGDTVRVESTHDGKASAIISALDRTFAAYSDDIEAETRTWLGNIQPLMDVFRHAFKLPTGKGIMDRARKQQEQTERETALDLREESLAKREQEHAVQETMLREERRAFDERKSQGDAITGESVTVTASGPVVVRVNVNGVVHTYTEIHVEHPMWEIVGAGPIQEALTNLANAWNWDTATDLPDWQVAERIREYIGNLTAMNAEIKGAGNVLTKDPELEEHADDSDGPTDDAEATVGTAPLGAAEVKELIRKRDRNLAGT